MKEVSLFPRLVEALGGAPGRCVVNLRPRKGIDGRMELVAAMPPSTFASLRGRRAVCRLGRKLVVAAGKVLAAVDDSVPSAMPSAGLSALPGEPLCALAVAAGESIVMTDGGPARVTDEGGMPVAKTCGYDYPPVTLRAVQVSLASSTVAARVLSATYGAEHRLTAADRSALVGDLEAAYVDAVSKASAQGCMVQPALARYRLLGRRGEVLFESPAVLLALPEGSQCAGTVDVRCDEGRNTSAYDVQLKAWRIEASIPAAAAPEVAALEVLVSPQFHPYRSGLRGTAVAVRDSGGYRVRVGLPGANAGLGADRGGSVSTVMKAIARMEAIEACAGRINSPFGGSERTEVIVHSPEGDAAEAMRGLAKALRAKVNRVDFADALLSAPHRFRASSVASDGVLVAWGAPRVMRYGGYPLPVFAASVGEGAWHATVTVRFDGRRGVSEYIEGNGASPASLNAVLSYPAPDARSMTVLLSAGGVMKRFDCELTPDESGRRAVYVAPDMQPVRLKTVSAAAIIDVENADEAFSDIIATAPADNPLAIAGAVRHGAGAVHALAAVGGSEQAWERGSSRFFAGCEGGVVSFAVARSGACTARVVDGRGVWRREDFAVTAGGVCALVGERPRRVPVVLSARGAVRELASGADYSMLVYDSRLGELWAVKTQGGADVFTAAGMYSRSCPAYSEAAEVSGEYYCVHEGGIDRVGLPAESGRVLVEYDDAFSPVGRGAFGLHSLSADIESTGAGGTLAVSAADGSGVAVRPFVERTFAGPVRSPMEIRVAGAPARSVSVRLVAMAEAATVLRSFMLRLSWMQR